MLEAVPNVSEGRDPSVIEAVGAAFAGSARLLDVHSDADHHRSVYTLVGESDPLVDALVAGVDRACGLVDLTRHEGVHPRVGAADVVPLVYLREADTARAASAALALAAGPAFAGGDRPAAEVEPRVAFHVRQANALADHFDALLGGACPRFPTRDEWDAYVEREIDRVVLMVAHVEEAWSEAKTTPDDDVRRAAKAPRRRIKDALPLADKLQACAESNGARLDGAELLQHVEREVPRRRAEIGIPR